MSNGTGPAPRPEQGPEQGPEPVSVPVAARTLGISERAVRKRINAGTLRAEPFGRSFRVWLPADAPEPVPEPGPAPGPEPTRGPGPGPEPIEARFRVTPAEIEQAVSRTSAQYMGDLRTMLAEVGKVYKGQLAAKDAALEAKDQTIATQAETIAELRRRAEVAEAEAQRLQGEVAHVRQQVAEVPEEPPPHAWWARLFGRG